MRLTLALAGTALMTAIAAAEMGAHSGISGDGGLSRAIRRQRVAEAVPANAEPAPAPAGAEAPIDTSTREGILAEATRLENQMNRAMTHVEQLRVVAYHDKNLIRMNFLTSKIDDMKQIANILSSAFAEIRKPDQDLFVMRAKLQMIRQGAERMREAAASAENSMNDDSPDTMGDIGSTNVQGSPNQGETDPTLPASPTTPPEVFDRPGEASPFQ